MRRSIAAIAVVLIGALAGCGQGSGSQREDRSPAVANLTMSGDGIGRPDPALTPGSTFGDVTLLQLCSPDYVRSVQQPSDLDERNVFGAYKLEYPAGLGAYRIDKLIPAELGGSEAVLNLWPEPRVATTAGRKDELATTLHQLVCAGEVPLDTVQSQVAHDWYAAWIKYVASTSPSPATLAAPLSTTAPAPAGDSVASRPAVAQAPAGSAAVPPASGRAPAVPAPSAPTSSGSPVTGPPGTSLVPPAPAIGTVPAPVVPAPKPPAAVAVAPPLAPAPVTPVAPAPVAPAPVAPAPVAPAPPPVKIPPVPAPKQPTPTKTPTRTPTK